MVGDRWIGSGRWEVGGIRFRHLGRMACPLALQLLARALQTPLVRLQARLIRACTRRRKLEGSRPE